MLPKILLLAWLFLISLHAQKPNLLFLKSYNADVNVSSSYFKVDEIPKFGTGKADFKGAKRLALELVG